MPKTPAQLAAEKARLQAQKSVNANKQKSSTPSNGVASSKKPTGSTSKPTGGTPKPSTTTAKPMQKSTDTYRYFVGERRGTSPTQEVTRGQYEKARTNPNLATIKINKSDSTKIANLSRSYGASEIKGFVKKKS